MIILAHRANIEGVNKATENSVEATRFCLRQGWGIETDIRRTRDGCFYISHDLAERTLDNNADSFCDLFCQYPSATVALNIKELGYEADLLDYLVQHQVLKQIFLFDMEMIEAQPGQTAALFRSLSSDVRLAARVSDRQETVDQALSIQVADVIWLDEFDCLWATEADIRRLKVAGKTVYAISPEIHGFSLYEMRCRWKQFYAWGVDGICTDYAAELSIQIQS